MADRSQAHEDSLAVVRRLRRRVERERWIAGLALPAWCAATGALVGQLFAPRLALVALAAASGGCLLWWIAAMRRRALRLEDAAVLADRAASAQGLLLASLERPVGAWEPLLAERLRAIRLPPARIWRPLGRVAAAALFAAASLLVPPWVRPGDAASNAAAGSKLAELRRLAETLEAEGGLEPEVVEQLESLEARLDGPSFEAEDWQATDGLEAAVQQRAAARALKLTQAVEAARALERAIERMEHDDVVAERREEVERALEALGEVPAGGGVERGRAGEVGGSAQRGPGGEAGERASGAPSPAGSGRPAGQAGAVAGSAERVARVARGGEVSTGGVEAGAGAETGRAGSLHPAGGEARDVGALRQALEARARRLSSARSGSDGRSGGGPAGAEARAPEGGGGSGVSGRSGARAAGGSDSGRSGGDRAGAGRASDPGPSHGAEGPTPARREGAGSGGLSRGPGTAPLTFEARLDRVPDLFPLERLPQGRSGLPGDVWGLRAVDPRRRAAGDSPEATGSAAEGGRGLGVWDESLLPRNRDLTRRYFSEGDR